MRLTDAERAENREAIEAMTPGERLDHIFEYYKFPLVLALIAVVAVGSVIYYRVTHKDALLYAGWANIAVGEDLNAELTEGFVKAQGLNPKRAMVSVYEGLYLSRDAATVNHEYAYASQMKVIASIANHQLDVVLMNREAYDLLSESGYLLPLDALLKDDAALLARVGECLTENTVILQDNDIEHRLDESVPYQAVTETDANAILISTFPMFERAGFSGEVYLGVIGNSERVETALQYIDYLTADEP